MHQTPLTGLGTAEVAARVSRGQTNDAGVNTSRTVGHILRANILTRFNFILGTLLIVIVVFGQPQDALFGIVLVANALIGIVQELRAKYTLDRLAVLNAPRAHVTRDGSASDIAIEKLVLDDLVTARTGDQIVADGTVRATTGFQADESLLTGESEPVDKHVGDLVRSGSFVVAGAGEYQATAVGVDAYAAQLAREARRFELVHSELIAGINRILRYVTWAIFPVAALLLLSQLHIYSHWREAVGGIVAALVGMVPQGLVLLTSIAFGVAAVTLARRKVLMQELPAVEGLARVDVICFDKTGTLTDGSIAFDRLEQLDAKAPVEAALGALADDENPNATLSAIAQTFANAHHWERHAAVPFHSTRKWSAASFTGHGTWILGAPEMILSTQHTRTLQQVSQLAGTGQRVLLLAQSSAPLSDDHLPDECIPAALVLFQEKIRSDAAETLTYFAQQGVAVKVISGDNPRTVGAVAAQAGITQTEEPVDARELPSDHAELSTILEERSVFGRVTPRQKQDMVKALQAGGHTVAMTGDGVNDALALKLADIGIAMGSGAAATRAVAQVVLLDGRLATLPAVVAEGRRVTANIERVANLFITKTVWATLLAVAVSLMRWPYPLLPRHLTIIDTLAIGIPAFFLALAPNQRRYQPGFANRVLRFALPAGLVIASTAFAAFWLAQAHGLPVIQQRTAATIVILMGSLCVLALLARPLTWQRVVLIGLLIGGFVLLFPLELVRSFYALTLPYAVLTEVLLIGVIGSVVLIAVWALL
jgi:cation-transporting ATPase E